MAARRIAVSAVDWTAFKQRVPPRQQEFYKAFKSKNDNFVNRVHQYSADLPKIDFSYYKGKLPFPALVDEFQKGYENVSIPYPSDKNNTVRDIENQEKEALEVSKKYRAERQQEINDAKLVLSKLDSVPKPSEMTLEMYAYYFPEKAINPQRPTFWPHIPKMQPGHKDSHLL